MISTARRIARRTASTLLAAGTSVGLIAAGTALIQAPAQAAEPAPVTATGALTWGISSHIRQIQPGFEGWSGVTQNATTKQISWPALTIQTGTDGTVTTTYGGIAQLSARSAASLGMSYASLMVSSPTLVVRADHSGYLEAAVSGSILGEPVASGPHPRVTLVRFSGAATTSASTTALPGWENVLTDAETIRSLDIPEGLPLEGKSFAPEFIAALPTGLRPMAYANGDVDGTSFASFGAPTGTGGDRYKAPERITTTARVKPASVTKTLPSTTVKVAKKATRKAAGRATLTVGRGAVRATGKATVTLTVPGVKKAKRLTVTLIKGQATVTLPKAKKKGTYRLSVAYAGSSTLLAARTVTTSFKVR